MSHLDRLDADTRERLIAAHDHCEGRYRSLAPHPSIEDAARDILVSRWRAARAAEVRAKAEADAVADAAPAA